MCYMGVKQPFLAGSWVVVSVCLQPSLPLATQTKDGKAGGGDVTVSGLSGQSRC